MNNDEHRAAAEHLLDEVDRKVEALNEAADRGAMISSGRIEAIWRGMDRDVARAQVHATLALGSET